MAKCHYINDKAVGRVLIPECIGTAAYYDISYCTCNHSSNSKSMDERVLKLESEIKELKKLIKLNNT